MKFVCKGCGREIQPDRVERYDHKELCHAVAVMYEDDIGWEPCGPVERVWRVDNELRNNTIVFGDTSHTMA